MVDDGSGDAIVPLLCESCGYELYGLGADGACPECGTAIAENLPERRVGSPWQRGMSVGAWFRTGVGVFLHPRRSMRDIRIEMHRSGELGGRNNILTNLLLGFGIAAHLLLKEVSAWDSSIGDALLGIAFLSPLLFIGMFVLMMLNSIEEEGVKFWGRRHGSRLTKETASAIVGHASYGWLVAGVLGALVLIVPPAVDALSDAQPFTTGGPQRRGFWYGRGALGMLGIAVLIGMLVFETLVYIGVRACRFANPPGVTLGPSEGVSGSAEGVGG